MLGENEIDEANDSKVREETCSHETEDDASDDGDSVSDDGNTFSSNPVTSVNDNEIASDVEKARDALAKLICFEEMPPLATTKFLHELNPKLEVGFHTVEADCLEIYEEEREKIKEVLRDFDGQISLSVEISWYEKRYCVFYDYMCLRAHFIDDSWNLKNWVLNFRHIRHPFEVQGATLESLKGWDVENKISTLTMVNPDDYDETFEVVKDHIQSKKELQLNGQLFCVYCCGDFISLMVQDAFNEIREIIDTVSELYSFGKSLPLWYLTNSRLKDALELESMGEFSSKDVTDHYKVPSADEWNKVRGICKLVDSIYEVANALFETKHITSNVYLHHLQELQAILTQESSNSDSFIRTVVEKMQQKFDKYWKDMFLVLTIATVMDPRYKMKYIEFSSSKFEGSDGNSQVRVLEAIHSLYDDYVTRFSGKGNSTSSTQEEYSPSHIEEGCCNSTVVFSDLQEYQQFIQCTSPPPRSDLDWYLKEPVLPWSQDFNALSWWRAASPKYPILSRMARDFLAIPISLATSFEAFYTQKREADRRIISLKPALMNALMCTRSWYKSTENSNGVWTSFWWSSYIFLDIKLNL
ncbi:hypothetical protein L1049_016933 [Liquidambar formosana]|uniref:Zinc finger BED domain-containing protein RICESLEEPER 2-like n=1 Tax=Liquidambar formosana TaxID=63359 RepID=A0AAP0X3F7_LIQFO